MFEIPKKSTDKTAHVQPHQPAPSQKTSDNLDQLTKIPLWVQGSLGNRVPEHLLPPMQRKESGTAQTAPGAKPPTHPTGLPDTVKTGIENLSGLALDDVRVHYNSAKPAVVQALAYTQGTDIHIAPGQEQHIAHEAWHVVQQKQGRVQPTVYAKSMAINNDDGLEHEADIMGTKAQDVRQLASNEGKFVHKTIYVNKGPAIQRMRVGAVPNAAWRTNHLQAHALYAAIGFTNADVADFTAGIKEDLLQANQLWTAYHPPVANPINVGAGGTYQSDENRIMLVRQQTLNNNTIQIDHIQPFEIWGANHPLNGRIISAAQNNPGPVSRPTAADLDILSLRAVTIAGVAYGPNTILAVPQLNALLQLALTNFPHSPSASKRMPTHHAANPLPAVANITNNDLFALYYNLPQDGGGYA